MGRIGPRLPITVNQLFMQVNYKLKMEVEQEFRPGLEVPCQI
jgi:hypothetical protein